MHVEATTRQRSGTRWLAALTCLAAALLVAGWWSGVRLSEVLHLAGLLAGGFGLLMLMFSSAAGFGSAIVSLAGLRDRAHPAFYLYSCATGLGALAHLTLLVGAAGLLRSEVIIALLGAGLALLGFDLKGHHDTYRSTLTQLLRQRQISWFAGIMLLALAISWLYPLFADALVPPMNWDEVAYHLAIPKIYIREGAVVYIPFIPYANWPLEAEMLFTIALLLGSETLAHLVSWGSMLLTCAAIVVFGRRYFGTEAALLAAAVFAATPMVGTLAGTSLIELPLTLFTFLTIAAFFDWLERGDRSSWLLAAICGGLAASTKLNAAMIPAIIGTLILLVSLARRAPLRVAITRFTLFGLTAFLVVAPWYLKNLLHTGNPFWPFLLEILGGRNWDALGNEYLLGFIRLPNLPTTPWNWLTGLWQLTFDYVEFGPVRVTLGWHYLALAPLCGLALVLWPGWLAQPRAIHDRRARQALGWLALLSLILYTNWFFQTHQTRFLMPATPVLALAGAAGAHWLWSIRAGAWRAGVQLAIAAGVIAALWPLNALDRQHIAGRWPFLSGQLDREAFLTEQIPAYAIYTYANQQLPDDAFVWLALYESRGYYLDRAYAWANPISQRWLRLEQYPDAVALAQELRARGFTHMIFRTDQLPRFTWIRYGEQITQLVLVLADTHARPVYTQPEIGLYELLP